MSEKPTMETEAKDWPGCPMCARLQRYADTAWNRGHTMGMKANEDTARQAMDALRAEKEAHAETNARLTEDNMRLERERDEAREALRDAMMDLDHMLLTWPRSAHEWAHGARKLQDKLRAFLAKGEQ